MRDVLAVILGGGQGRRLFPLTKFRAKPAVPIGGKFRLIDIPISNCIHSNIKKIFVLTQFNTLSLHRHITGTYKFDGFSKGFLQILAAQQTINNKNWYQGTADAVRQNINYIKNLDIKYIAILSGDQLYRINLKEFIKFHQECNAHISIASKPINREMARHYGVLKIDETFKIKDFIEKPGAEKKLDHFHNSSHIMGGKVQENFLASMGIYIFNKDVLINVLEQNLDEDFGKQIIPYSIHQYNVFAYVFNGYWEDIGTIKSFFEANIDFAASIPKFNFYDEKNPIFTRARFLPGSKVKKCEINQALISDGSILEGSKISNSVVGLRSIIKQGSSLERVVMMGSDFYEAPDSSYPVKVGIGCNCFIRNTIIDKNVRIGDHVYINYNGSPGNTDKGFYFIIDGVVVIPKNSEIPAKTRIE